MHQDFEKQFRIIFRSFKRSASRLRDGSRSLRELKSFQYSMSCEENKGVKSIFEEAQPLVQYAALLRPFMRSSSPIELCTVWKLLSQDSQLINDTTRKKIMDIFSSANKLCFGIVLNEKTLTARDLYFAYAEGELFDENTEAKKMLEQLSFGPMREMVLFLFYDACIRYSKLVFAILDVILNIEQCNPRMKKLSCFDPQCIYCLTRDGNFDSEEHVIPETFGIDELILHDAVCQTCNNKLSKLDQFLAEFDLLAFLRVQNVPLTKKGKFPRANFRDFTLEKMKPRVLRFTSKTNKDIFVKKDLPDESFHLSLNITTAKPVDIHQLSRALFKIGLGLVAYDRGVEYARNNRFNAARSFINGVQMMPNHLILARNGIPDNKIETVWNSFDSSTIVCLSLFGMLFAFNLEPSAFGIPTEAQSDMFLSFWLGTVTKGGIIPPCQNKCEHS